MTMRDQFPTKEQVDEGTVEEVIRWNRFLPAPRNEDELFIINRNFDRMGKLQIEDSGAFTAASKAVGW